MSREAADIKLTQERFTVHFANAPALQWQIPLTYVTELQPTTEGFLLRERSGSLPNELPEDRALKFNLGDAGYYRVEYDETSWKLLTAHIAQLSPADRVNLLSDDWALLEANRKPLSHYLALVDQVLKDDQLAVYDQIIDSFLFVNRLLAGDPIRPRFQQHARLLLRPAFDRVGWEAKENEADERPFLRASLIRGLGLLNDPEVVAGCRDRFNRFLSDPAAISPDLRPDIFAVVGRYADAPTWEKLHRLGLKTTSTEEKAYFYGALAATIDPKLVRRALPLALTEELPTSQAAALSVLIARDSEHPELVWEFAREHMKELVAKQDAIWRGRFVPGLFTFFSDPKDADALQNYAKSDLSVSSANAVAIAVDEIGFRADLKKRVVPQLKTWTEQDAR